MSARPRRAAGEPRFRPGRCRAVVGDKAVFERVEAGRYPDELLGLVPRSGLGLSCLVPAKEGRVSPFEDLRGGARTTWCALASPGRRVQPASSLVTRSSMNLLDSIARSSQANTHTVATPSKFIARSVPNSASQSTSP